MMAVFCNERIVRGEGGGGGGGGEAEELISILYQETKGKICISGRKYRKKCLDSGKI